MAAVREGANYGIELAKKLARENWKDFSAGL